MSYNIREKTQFFNIIRSRRSDFPIVLAPTTISYVAQIKLLNYYPSTHPWDAMYNDDAWWSSGQAEIEIKRELWLIRNLAGCNVIRVFARYNALGGVSVNATKRSYLENIINWAGLYGLKSIVALFDGLSGSDFDPPNWGNHKSHLNGIVGYFRTNTNILAWDLKNEYTLIYSPINQAKTEAWAREMILHIKSLDPNHLIMAESDSATSQWLNDCIELGASHLYKDIPDVNAGEVDTYYNTASLNKGRPFLCGETNWTSATYSDLSTDSRDKGDSWQARYLNKTLSDLSYKDCGVGVWTAFDFPTLAVNDRERYFGVFREYPACRIKPSLKALARHSPNVVSRRLFNDSWSITTDFRDFETALGLTVLTGSWTRVSDTQQDGTTGHVAEQNQTVWIGGWDGKVAISSIAISADHLHVEAYVKIVSTTGAREAGIVFNCDGTVNNLYRVYINGNFNVFSLKKVSAGTESLLAEYGQAVSSNTWYKISVTVHTNTYGGITYKNIRAFLNDGSLNFISYDDSSPLSGGKAGLYTQGNTIARFNNFKASYISKTRTLL
jgi:hypothetical protein